MPRLACSLDTMLARHARAVVALGEPAHASSLESALVRAGRWEEAYLLRWRRGEPSLVAAALAEEQRPALAALDADPALQVVPCEVCGPGGCGHNAVEVATGGSRDALRWTALGAGNALPDAVVVGARGVRRAEELVALGPLETLAVLELSCTALRSGASLPLSTDSLTVQLGDEGGLEPQHVGALEQLRALELRGRLTDERLEALLESCDGRLERLRVDADLLTDVGLESLERAPRLRELALRGAPWLDGSGLRALVDVGAPLERFSLRGAPMSTWRTLDAIGSLETVKEVELLQVAFEDDGLGALAELPHLRHLTLTHGSVGPGAFDELVEARVQRVDIAHMGGVDDLTLETFATSSTLRALSLVGALEPSRRGWAALACTPRLERLKLARCSIDADALAAVARSASVVDLTLEELEASPAPGACTAIGRMSRLARLSLVGLFATPAVLNALAEGATRITALELNPLPRASSSLLEPVGRLLRVEQLKIVTPTVPGAIASLASAAELRELTLSYTSALDDAELAALRACVSLRSLSLWCDEPTRLRTAEALPGVDVQSLNPSVRSPIAES